MPFYLDVYYRRIDNSMLKMPLHPDVYYKRLDMYMMKMPLSPDVYYRRLKAKVIGGTWCLYLAVGRYIQTANILFTFCIYHWKVVSLIYWS